MNDAPKLIEIENASRPASDHRGKGQGAPRWAVIGIFLLLSIAAIGFARDFLMPAVLAFLLALVFSPVRRFLDRRGFPSGVSACLIVGALVTTLLAGMAVLAAPITEWIDNAPTLAQQLQEKLSSLRGSVATVMEAGEQVEEITSAEPGTGVQEVVVREPGLLAGFALVAPTIMAQAVFALVLLLFLLSSGEMFYEKLVHVMPTFKDKKRAIRIAYDIERKLSRYLFTITVINAGLGIAIGISMWLLDMPNPILFAVIGFAFNFIPYLGAVAGVILTGIVGLLTFDQAGHALLAATVYFSLTTIEGQFITPYFVGRRLEMNTVAVFLSVALWAWLWSVVGMLVAVPLLVAVRAFCEHIPQLQGLGDFLSARGSETGEDENRAAKAG